MAACCRLELAKPAVKRDEIRRSGVAPRRVELRRRAADDPACLVIVAVHGHRQQRAWSGRPFQKHGVAVMFVDMRGAVAVPPVQDAAPSFSSISSRDLQHGGHIRARGQAGDGWNG